MEANKKSFREEALAYHAEGRPGKIEVIPTKPYSTQKTCHWPTLQVWPNPASKFRKIPMTHTNIPIKETLLP